MITHLRSNLLDLSIEDEDRIPMIYTGKPVLNHDRLTSFLFVIIQHYLQPFNVKDETFSFARCK